MDECKCSEIKLNGKKTGLKNWNPDCPVHTQPGQVGIKHA